MRKTTDADLYKASKLHAGINVGSTAEERLLDSWVMHKGEVKLCRREITSCSSDSACRSCKRRLRHSSLRASSCCWASLSSLTGGDTNAYAKPKISNGEQRSRISWDDLQTREVWSSVANSHMRPLIANACQRLNRILLSTLSPHRQLREDVLCELLLKHYTRPWT